MPFKPKHACAFPQCPEIISIDERYCEKHKKIVSKQYEATRETAVKRGYNTRHQKWRKMILARYPICQRCNKVPSTIAHHIDRNVNNRSIENGMGLCESCHNVIHAKEGERWKRLNE